LTFIEDGNPDFLQGGGINFYKWRKVADVVNDILLFQTVPYPPPEHALVIKKAEFYLHKSIQIASSLGSTGLFKISKKFE